MLGLSVVIEFLFFRNAHIAVLDMQYWQHTQIKLHASTIFLIPPSRTSLLCFSSIYPVLSLCFQRHRFQYLFPLCLVPAVAVSPGGVPRVLLGPYADVPGWVALCTSCQLVVCHLIGPTCVMCANFETVHSQACRPRGIVDPILSECRVLTLLFNLF